jgi:hypothetical protein
MYRGIWLVVIGSGLSLLSYAQLPDTLLVSVSMDSLLQQKLQALDSIQQLTGKQYTALKQQYDSIEQTYTSLATTLQQRVDSLNLVGSPTEKLISQIDSLNSLKEQKLWDVRTKAQKQKRSSLDKMESLSLSLCWCSSPTKLRPVKLCETRFLS